MRGRTQPSAGSSRAARVETVETGPQAAQEKEEAQNRLELVPAFPWASDRRNLWQKVRESLPFHTGDVFFIRSSQAVEGLHVCLHWICGACT